MDREVLSILTRTAQFVLLLGSFISVGTAMDHYRSLYRLAASARPIKATTLSSYPESLRWYFFAFCLGLIGAALLQLVYDRLRSNNSFKPKPLRGSA